MIDHKKIASQLVNLPEARKAFLFLLNRNAQLRYEVAQLKLANNPIIEPRDDIYKMGAFARKMVRYTRKLVDEMPDEKRYHHYRRNIDKVIAEADVYFEKYKLPPSFPPSKEKENTNE